MRFLGNIEAKTDAKGRAFLPAVFRKVLQASGSEKLMMRKDLFQDCLVLFPEDEWNRRVEALHKKLNPFNAKHQIIYRQYLAEAESVELDGNGRFLIPKRYLQMAGIQQEIRFIGLEETIEIWANEKFAESRMPDKEFGQAIESIMGDNTPLPIDI